MIISLGLIIIAQVPNAQALPGRNAIIPMNCAARVMIRKLANITAPQTPPGKNALMLLILHVRSRAITTALMIVIGHGAPAAMVAIPLQENANQRLAVSIGNATGKTQIKAIISIQIAA